MSFVLDKNLEAKLVKPLPEVDKGIARVLVTITPDHDGNDSLFFRVVLKDDPTLASPSLELGKRLGKIAGALRERAARLDVPGFAYVDFALESELARPKRKTA